MRPEEMLDILKRAGRLKIMTRHCYTEPDRKESVADHSWRIALMAMLLTGEGDLRGVDMDRVIRMCSTLSGWRHFRRLRERSGWDSLRK